MNLPLSISLLRQIFPDLEPWESVPPSIRGRGPGGVAPAYPSKGSMALLWRVPECRAAPALLRESNKRGRRGFPREDAVGSGFHAVILLLALGA